MDTNDVLAYIDDKIVSIKARIQSKHEDAQGAASPARVAALGRLIEADLYQLEVLEEVMAAIRQLPTPTPPATPLTDDQVQAGTDLLVVWHSVLPGLYTAPRMREGGGLWFRPPYSEGMAEINLWASGHEKVYWSLRVIRDGKTTGPKAVEVENPADLPAKVRRVLELYVRDYAKGSKKGPRRWERDMVNLDAHCRVDLHGRDPDSLTPQELADLYRLAIAAGGDLVTMDHGDAGIVETYETDEDEDEDGAPVLEWDGGGL